MSCPFVLFNPHPHGLLVDDCVKRSIVAVTGMDYMEVQRQLNRYKKVTGAKCFNSNYNPHCYVENVLGGIKMICYPDESGKRPTVAEFAAAHPIGHFILDVKGHWTALMDGVIRDTWNPSEREVYVAWRVFYKGGNE